jgi:hypothetical protein
VIAIILKPALPARCMGPLCIIGQKYLLVSTYPTAWQTVDAASDVIVKSWVRFFNSSAIKTDPHRLPIVV